MNGSVAVYLDTSVLAKWYIAESNSEQVSAYIIGLDEAFIGTLSKTEMRCLLARRKGMQEFNADIEGQLYATFLDDIAQGHLSLCKVEDKHLENAANLISILPGHALRTLDASHLAIAQHHGIERLAAADNLFANAASALGFAADRFA